MLRRRMIEPPVSRLAIWARRFAVFALAVAVLSVIILRAGLVEIVPGLVTFGAALVIAGLGILLAFGAFIVIWREGARGFGLACWATLIGAALLAYPGYLGAKAYRLPALNDVTTDTNDPPRFDAVARQRPRGSNPAAYPGAEAAKLQRQGYPDLESLELPATPLQAYNAAMSVIAKRKWTIVTSRPPQGRRDGSIEATARSPVMGFRDDIAVRVRTISGSAKVDIRSASRYGRHDLGANAARIRSLAEDIEEAVSAQLPTRR